MPTDILYKLEYFMSRKIILFDPIEAELGVAVANQAIPVEVTVLFLEQAVARMFGDDQGIGIQQMRAPEKAQDVMVLSYFFVGGIKKEVIELRAFLLQALDSGCDRGPDQVITRLDSQGIEVITNKLLRRAMMFDKNHFARPPAQRLEPHGAASGISVKESRPIDPWTQYIKQRLAHLVGGGPEMAALQGAYVKPAVCAGNYSHCLIDSLKH